MKENASQNGQAMTELLVSLWFLIPLFLLMPLMGKYLDMQHTMNNAARYAAWEYVAQQQLWEEFPSQADARDNNTPSRSESAILANQIRERFFFHPLNGITEHDNSVHNEIWRDNSGATLLSYESGEPVSPTIDIERSLPNSDEITLFDTLLRWDIDSKNLIWATVNMPVNPFPMPMQELFDSPRAPMRATSALIADSLVPRNEEEFSERVRALQEVTPTLFGFSIAPQDLREMVTKVEKELNPVTGTPGLGLGATYPVEESEEAVLSDWKFVPDDQSQILPPERQVP